MRGLSEVVVCRGLPGVRGLAWRLLTAQLLAFPPRSLPWRDLWCALVGAEHLEQKLLPLHKGSF